MNLSTFSTIGNRAPNNFTLLVLDNGSYGSTRWSKNIHKWKNLSLKEVALGAGCKNVIECEGQDTSNQLEKAIKDKKNSYVIISKINPGNVLEKPIPLNPITIRDRFRKYIGLVSYL